MANVVNKKQRRWANKVDNHPKEVEVTMLVEASMVVKVTNVVGITMVVEVRMVMEVTKVVGSP